MSSASGTCRRWAPGTCARTSTSMRPELVLIEGLDDANDLMPDITRKADASRRSPSWPTPTRCPSARSSIPWRATARNTRRSAGRTNNDVRGRVHRSALRHLSRLAGPRSRAAGEGREASETRSGARGDQSDPKRRPPADLSAVPEPRRSLYEQIAELAGETRLRHLLGAPLRAQPAAGQLPPGVVRAGPGRPRAGRRRAALAGGEPGPRSVHAPPDRGDDRRRTSSRTGSSPSSARSTAPVLTGEFPGHDRRGTGLAAAAARAS